MASESNPHAARPLVSIIVPSYNQGRFIRRTLESILSQDYRPIEILVIDGASRDETVSILEEFSHHPELRWVSEPDSGVVEAVNKGFARARGEIGAIQSSDDFYLPGAISAGVAALQSDPALAFVFGDIAKVDAEGKELSRTQLAPYSLVGVLTMETWIPQPSTFFRMPLAKSLGGWREEVPYAADTDLWLRMALKHSARKLDRLMAERSMHEAQRDKHGLRIVRDYAKTIDTLPGLKEAPSTVKRAAEAGKWLMANRYDVEAGELTRVARLWFAVGRYPKIGARYTLRDFIPGGNPLRALATRLARRFHLR
ncbi:MAG: glycosyltransferase [Xanthomonadales bacterium]|nr:glycosyltransferase [Xanthomonadales bacterium]MBK7143981.1 glycosyltransferase [Xanthomonadales bacterium]MCC6561965.1 glycosyltransferase [Xanthomonadales bacterium]